VPGSCSHRVVTSALAGTVLSLIWLAASAAANDPGQDAYMTRVMKCVDQYLTVEIYLPNKNIFRYPAPANIPGHDYMLSTLLSMPPTIGWYALDLSDAGKGKSLEPVRVSVSPDKKAIIVDQYTRGTATNKIPPTRVPIIGGTAQFDPKWATQVKCDELLKQD
jgi:hypothetical protein